MKKCIMKKREGKRKKRVGLWIFAATLLIVGLGLGRMFGPMVKAAGSVQKLDEGLYSLEFSGDDGFAGYLEQGGAASAQGMGAYIVRFLSHGFARMPEAPAEAEYGCATLAARTPDGGRLLGRNFDWTDGALCVIATVHPRDGYSYISAFNADFLGFGPEWKPEGFANQYMAVASIFLALDGVNEKGLAIADLTAGEGETHQDAGRPDLTTTCAIKYLLKSAASVDEAVRLLEDIDYHSDIGCLHHLSMSDASGQSVVVEYVDDRMVVTPTTVVTNHYLCQEAYGYGLFEGDCRYERLAEESDAVGGTMDTEQLLQAMATAWQVPTETVVNGGTQWTALFNLTDRCVDYVWQRDTNRRYHFSL